MEVKIRLESELAKMPAYQTSGSSGMDVTSIESTIIAPGFSKMVSTGLSFEIPEGYEIQVRPRSGLAAKYNVTVLNTPGTIDSDYRGILKVILINLGSSQFPIEVGDRIAQIVFAPVVKATLVNTTELNQTDRGAGGFGSTGTK